MEALYHQKYTKDQIGEVALKLKELLSQCKVMTFTGSLGAGKTTLIGTMLRNMGVTEHITSPTFTYVNIYTMPDGKKIYHFDLYRINTVDEFIMAGFDEYLYAPNSWALIEWPAVIMPLLDHAVCNVTIDHDVNQLESREIRVSCLEK